MALIKSHIASQIVNSIGGITYFYNRYGSIVARTRTHPTNPSTAAQSAARAVFSAAVTGWKSITQAQRDLWDDYAKNTPVKNGLGDTVYLTGQAWYIAIYTSAIVSGASTDPGDMDDCSCDPGVFPEPTVAVVECETPGECGGVLTLTNNHDTLACKFIVWISPAQSVGRTYYKGPWVYDAKQLSGEAAAGGDAQVSFCELCEGQRYFYMVRAISSIAPFIISLPIYGYFDATCVAVE